MTADDPRRPAEARHYAGDGVGPVKEPESMERFADAGPEAG